MDAKVKKIEVESAVEEATTETSTKLSTSYLKDGEKCEFVAVLPGSSSYEMVSADIFHFNSKGAESKETENLNEIPSAQSSRNDNFDSERIFQVKWINYRSGNRAILMQNENGPCPLLAVANVLLLRGWICLEEKREFVEEREVLCSVTDCILRSMPTNLTEADQLNYEQNVSDVLTLVPSLTRGLDVNLHFTGVNKFEYTTACALFDLLNISLLHGWVVDPQDVEIAGLLKGLGYNQLVEKVINAENDNLWILRLFLEVNSSQLTVYGLSQLSTVLANEQLAVLFRNNHFYTLLKHNNELYVLANDLGFHYESSVVWETLNSVDGDSVFVDENFNPAKIIEKNDEALDHLLALSLQNDEINQESRSDLPNTTSFSSPPFDARNIERKNSDHAATSKQSCEIL